MTLFAREGRRHNQRQPSTTSANLPTRTSIDPTRIDAFLATCVIRAYPQSSGNRTRSTKNLLGDKYSRQNGPTETELMTIRRLAVILALTLALSGCTLVPTSSSDRSDRAPVSSAASPSAVPQVVGMQADKAQKTLEDAGFLVELVAAEGSVWMASNWSVSSQNLRSGKDSDTAVLAVMKTEEWLELKAEADKHTDEETFEGIVTGHLAPEDDYGTACDDTLCVRVDDATVNLSLIGLFGASCYEFAPAEEEAKAVAAKVDLLPVGTRVRVVRTEPGDNYEGFIHILPEAEPLVAGPEGSVNQQLVEGGYWMPKPYSVFNDGAVRWAHEALFRVKDGAILTPVESTYAPLIVEAGNLSRVGGIGGQAICVEQLAQKAIHDAELEKLLEESNRRTELWHQEWLRNHPNGVQCRDGDGDGRCYEG